MFNSSLFLIRSLSLNVDAIVLKNGEVEKGAWCVVSCCIVLCCVVFAFCFFESASMFFLWACAIVCFICGCCLFVGFVGVVTLRLLLLVVADCARVTYGLKTE